MSRVRWGIIGAGSIASRFSEALAALPDAETLAVGSRSQDSADRFARANGFFRAHGSYEDLAADPDVDVVYVATPHPFHAENVELCLNEGKAVVCEKPFTVNAAEARRVVELARRRGLFLMEGMWTRFFPLMERLRKVLAGGAIGEPRMLTVDFGFRAPFDPASRLFDPNLGGGAMLDVGVYCVSFASMALGPPVRGTGLSHLGETGVDEQFAAALDHGGGRLSSVTAGTRTATPHEATVFGTEGYLRIHSPWWRPEAMTISKPGTGDVLVREPTEENGFVYEAAEVMRCLRAGKKESEVMPLDETISVLDAMDRIREAWGLRYPGEEAGA
ncbi:gfo/Idh/MocA family oxidoreductase [Rubrobacter tropicus]|uniref:Gfo/Idh/MocA family oxidoreductase n=1 Tax=Rubrobacter tropicus TaxID=2653851 RepID=A0A6G8QAJ8_9ACTN|nr:Gfo/Idh/MocA family oxidoreductase [Rubrobacter tropicus]QIN83510.1 gfo/Idh/MocA family oxidoreductase [Rubrobacter tropicus]